MPWQRLVVDVGLEVEPDGTPAYREVVVTVPRQSGKTTLVLAIQVDRCIAWGSPQRCAYTAQTGQDARKKLLDDQVPMLERSPLWAAVAKVNRAQGNEGVVFRTGSRIDVLASTETAGHGKTLDLGVIDEAFADYDDRREQSMLPAMLTRPSAQLLVPSTAGTDASTFLWRKVELGRRAVEAGRTDAIAYFEWSASDDADPDDPAVWFGCMPALGITQPLGAVQHARATMSDGEFRRSMLNQWTRNDERAIPASIWDAVCSPDVVPVDPLKLAVEVSPERESASLVVCGHGDRRAVELVDHRPGVSWVVERVAQVVDRSGAEVVVDAGGPAGALLADLDDAGVNVTRVGARDVVQACGAFFDGLSDGSISVRTNDVVSRAAAAVSRRKVADAWAWSRSSVGGVDVTPIMAASLAAHGGPGGFFVY